MLYSCIWSNRWSINIYEENMGYTFITFTLTSTRHASSYINLKVYSLIMGIICTTFYEIYLNVCSLLCSQDYFWNIDNDRRKRGKYINITYACCQFHFISCSDFVWRFLCRWHSWYVLIAPPVDTDSPRHLVSPLTSRSLWLSTIVLVSVPYWHCLSCLVFIFGSYIFQNTFVTG